MKRPIVRLTGVKAGGGRERACQRRPKNTFSFTLSVLFLPVLSSGLWPASASLADCTALHCSLRPIPSSSFPKWPHKQALTAAEAAEGGREAGRRTDDAIHTFLTLPTATHSLFTTQRRKEGRKTTDDATDGDPRSFPTFALSLSLSLSLPLSLF